MQLVILIYWVTGGADDVTGTQLPLQNHVQLLISAHLFILGYQHFLFMWSQQTAAKEFVKFCQVGQDPFLRIFDIQTIGGSTNFVEFDE